MCSSLVEHPTHDRMVSGSNPKIPIAKPMDIDEQSTTKKRKYTENDNGSSNSVFIAGNKKMRLMGRTVFNLSS